MKIRVLFAVLMASSLGAADEPLIAGAMVRKAGLCSAFLRGVAIHSSAYAKVFRLSNRDDLNEYWGEQVRIRVLHDSPKVIPAQYTTVQYSVSYQSVYGGPERSTPPPVGAWWVIDRRNDPLEETYTSRPEMDIGQRLRFESNAREIFVAYAHPGEAPRVGKIYVQRAGFHFYSEGEEGPQTMDLNLLLQLGTVILVEPLQSR